jgi:hypothetical protein
MVELAQTSSRVEARGPGLSRRRVDARSTVRLAGEWSRTPGPFVHDRSRPAFVGTTLGAGWEQVSTVAVDWNVVDVEIEDEYRAAPGAHRVEG